MDTALEQALSLLLSGMLTVFVVLGLVVLMGRLLITIVNRFAAPTPDPRLRPAELPLPTEIDSKIIAAIAAAVDISTQGNGYAKKITIINENTLS